MFSYSIGAQIDAPVHTYIATHDSHLLSQSAAVIIGPDSNQNTDINRFCAIVGDI